MNDEGSSFFEVWHAIKNSGEQLGAGERWMLTVLLGFVNFHHEDGAHIWPSDETIASQSGASPRTVRNHRRGLQSKGLISWTRNPGGSNSTFVNLNAILELADDPTNHTKEE